MLNFLKRLLDSFIGVRDEQIHPQSPSQERIKLIDVEEPMAGAGALLSGSHIKSETEAAIERASTHDQP